MLSGEFQPGDRVEMTDMYGRRKAGVVAEDNMTLVQWDGTGGSSRVTTDKLRPSSKRQAGLSKSKITIFSWICPSCARTNTLSGPFRGDTECRYCLVITEIV
jgi:hypothetical protein